MAKGGARKGAGRPKGAISRVNDEARKAAAAAGETPLEYMLRVMRDTNENSTRRDEMALAAAPYMHAKLQQMDIKSDTTVRTVSADPITPELWQQQHSDDPDHALN